MAFAGTVIGAFLGLTTKLGSNVLQKVPYMRRTWRLWALNGRLVGPRSPRLTQACGLRVDVRQTRGSTCC